MGLETVTDIDDLDISNPLGTDPRSQGDDHIRNIKKALKTDFPSITGAMTATQAELNVLDGVTAGTVTASKGVVVDATSKVDVWNVDNLTIDGNTLTANTGAINITPAAGSAIVLDATINVDAGVVTGATSITSTTFSGDLTGAVTGNADTATSATTAGTVTTAAQTAITSLGTLTALQTDNININGNTIISTDTAGNINVTPDTTGDLILDGVKWPQADGTANQILTTDGAAQAAWGSPVTTTALTTHGDVLFQNASGLQRLAIGATGTFLQSAGAGADVLWATASTATSTDTFTNKTIDANGTGNSITNIDVADLAVGTDGELITWDSSGNPAVVAVGTAGQVLTSGGVGVAPTFAAGGSTGTFTPGITFGGAAVGLTYSQQTGFYTDLGNGLVHVTMTIVLSAVGSSTGTANVTGLPFTANATHYFVGNAFRVQGFSALSNNVSFRPVINTTTGELYNSDGATRTVFTNSHFTSSSNLQITLLYVKA
jgi:hypothetical protein